MLDCRSSLYTLNINPLSDIWFGNIFSHSVAGRATPSRAQKWALILTLGNELSKETRVLTKQEILLGKGTGVESSRVREPRRTALPRGSQSWGLW